MVRAPLRVLPRSLAPSGVLEWGRSGPGSPLPGLACTPCGGCVPRGWWGAVPGKGGLPLLSGASGVRCCPSPDRPSSGAGSRGTATRVFRVRSMRAWGPSSGSTACALAGRRCSLSGWRKGVPGRGAFHRCEGRLRSGAPLPRLPSHLVGCWGPSPTCCGCGRVGVGAHHCPFGLHALWGLRAAEVAGGRPRGGGLLPL